MPLCEVRSVSKSFGGLQALKGVGLWVDPNMVTAIIGPNGAGKTTLFNLMTGLETWQAGELLVQGVNMAGRSPQELANAGLARTFQNLQVFEGLSVLENAMLGAHRLGRAGFWASALRWPSVDREENKLRERAFDLLERVGLADRAHLPAGQLTFGQQRMVEVARALASNPTLLLLDEPASGLNATESDELVELIRQVKDRGLGVILVEHDMEVVMGLADRVFVLNQGQLIAEGSPKEVQGDPRVVEAYLGEDD